MRGYLASVVLALTTPSLARADAASFRADLDAATSAVKPARDSWEATSGVGASLVAGASADYATAAGHSSSFVQTTASASLRAGTGASGLTFEQAGRVRPYGLELMQFEFGDRLALDVAPSLGDRPDHWRRRYSAAGFELEVIAAQSLGTRWGAQLMRIANGFAREVQHDGDVSVGRIVETADWAPLSFTLRHDGEETSRLDPLVLEAHAIGGQHSGAVLTVFYPRITGLPLGALKLDLAVGDATVGYSQTTVNGATTTITSEHLPDLHVPAARARLSGSVGGFEASAGVERGMYLSMDAALVVEERATASVATTINGARLTASGFAAHSVIWTSPSASTEHVTGGGSLALDVGLADHWRLGNQAQLARTFYASLDGGRAPQVETALRFDVALHRTIANWVPKQRP